MCVCILTNTVFLCAVTKEISIAEKKKIFFFRRNARGICLSTEVCLYMSVCSFIYVYVLISLSLFTSTDIY